MLIKNIVILLLMLVASCASGTGVDFTLPDVDGVNHRLSDYRGKWVVVNFWATWCAPCLQEIPELEEFHAKHAAKDAMVLAINTEDIEPATLRAFMDEHFINYPVLRGGVEPDTRLDPGMGLPTTILISPGGEVAIEHLGPVTSREIEILIRAQILPAEKSPEAPVWMPWRRHQG